MIYSLIALSFLCSVAVGIVFRYKDRTEVRQIRRQSEQHHTDLQQIADERIRAIDDATIDFEMKVRQARAATDEINSLIENNQTQIQ
ncbi:MAG: hypothetical protein H3C43_14105, partial [Leptonema sp. (in: Bacteria)]|nr:hypothetical protein [Leptonema sp. (in: bacteria)]